MSQIGFVDAIGRLQGPAEDICQMQKAHENSMRQTLKEDCADMIYLAVLDVENYWRS